MKIARYIGPILITLLLGGQSLTAKDDPQGDWLMLHPNTKIAEAVITVYKSGNVYYGRIKTYLGDPTLSICKICPGDNQDKSLKGMIILWGLVQDGDEYKNGSFLNHTDGTVSPCKLWIRKDRLYLRTTQSNKIRTFVWSRHN